LINPLARAEGAGMRLAEITGKSERSRKYGLTERVGGF